MRRISEDPEHDAGPGRSRSYLPLLFKGQGLLHRNYSPSFQTEHEMGGCGNMEQLMAWAWAPLVFNASCTDPVSDDPHRRPPKARTKDLSGLS